MKKQIKILVLAVMLIVACMLPVNATDAIVTLNASQTQLYAGETFTVIINVACEEGINGLEGVLNYDKNKLELSDVQILNTLNWSLMNEQVEGGLSLGIINNSTDKTTSADILKLTFKVKTTATQAATTKITFANVVLGTDAQANSVKELGTKEVEISILERLRVEITEFEQAQEGTNKYINKINIGTLIQALVSKIQTNGQTKVFKGNTQITDLSQKLATGMEIRVSLNNEIVKYKAVVKGDTSGDGEATFTDILEINRHRLNKTLLTGAYLKAGDVTEDGQVNFADILLINKYRLGKINSL